MITADADLVMPADVIVKVAVFDPAATVTVAGTVALTLSDVSLITDPPVGAGRFKVTVAVELDPPITVEGANVREEGTGTLRILLTRPLKFGAPHPDAVSQPALATERFPLGRLPLFPDTTSKKTVGSPFIP